MPAIAHKPTQSFWRGENYRPGPSGLYQPDSFTTPGWGGNNYAVSRHASSKGSMVMLPDGDDVGILPKDQVEEQMLSAEEMPWRKKFSSICTIYIGRRGHGKTLTMTAVAKFLNDAYIAQESDFAVASNYWTSFSWLYHPHLVPMLNLFPEWARNLHCLIDEISAYTPSGRGGSRFNLDFSLWIQQMRKFNIDLAGTTQFPQWVDQKLLVQCDIFIECEQLFGGRAVRLYIHDFWGQWSGRNYRKPFPPYKDEADFVRTLFNTHTVFGHYKTDEYQVPVWSDYRDEGVAAQMRRHGRTGNYESLEEEGEEAEAPKPKKRRIIDPADGVHAMLPHRFNPAAYLDDVKRIMPAMTSRKAFAEWLESQGYTIEVKGGQYMAIKPEELME